MAQASRRAGVADLAFVADAGEVQAQIREVPHAYFERAILHRSVSSRAKAISTGSAPPHPAGCHLARSICRRQLSRSRPPLEQVLCQSSRLLELRRALAAALSSASARFQLALAAPGLLLLAAAAPHLAASPRPSGPRQGWVPRTGAKPLPWRSARMPVLPLATRLRSSAPRTKLRPAMVCPARLRTRRLHQLLNPAS